MNVGVLIAIAVVCGLICLPIGHLRGRGLAESLMFGLFAGPLGVLCVALLKPSYPKVRPGGWQAPPG